MAEEIFGEALAAGAVVGGDGFLAAVVDVEAGMFPGEEVGEFAVGEIEAGAEGVAERRPEVAALVRALGGSEVKP